MIRLLAALLVLIARAPWRRLRWLAGSCARWLTWRTRVLRFRYVYDVEGCPYPELDPDRSWCSHYDGACGGCDACLLAQAEHYGAPVHPIPVEVRR